LAEPKSNPSEGCLVTHQICRNGTTHSGGDRISANLELVAIANLILQETREIIETTNGLGMLVAVGVDLYMTKPFDPDEGVEKAI
jgi:hypothetical protein